MADQTPKPGTTGVTMATAQPVTNDEESQKKAQQATLKGEARRVAQSQQKVTENARELAERVASAESPIEFEVVHTAVGMYSQGDIVDSSMFDIDSLQRLVEVGALKEV